jgi:hypothetical protein
MDAPAQRTRAIAARTPRRNAATSTEPCMPSSDKWLACPTIGTIGSYSSGLAFGLSIVCLASYSEAQ